ncbi:MAG: isoleucine--tRNA ligase [Alphaproteobacteria bacterium]|nr:isoleucine--tRNA ligase [Alphaproteobacteria bacterium]
MSSAKHYRETSPKPDFNALEQEVLSKWDLEKDFEKSISIRADANDFVFYDGPPFATGTPHYGHVLQSYNKDTIGRYKTMRGFRVERRWGWDCHGLPLELKLESALGISGKKAIKEYGVDRFVEKGREFVMAYDTNWKASIRRMGRWVDMENDYKTMDKTYMESVVWAFAELYKKGLIYEDFRVMPYSWAAESVLSNFEVNQPGCYRDRLDPAITVKFKLATGEYLLAWTTTPWTLPSNMLLAVGADIEYGVYKLASGDKVIMAKSRAAAYKKELADAEMVAVRKGSELVGMSYEPLFPYANSFPMFKVLAGEFVSDADGTGIVHIAPAFGENDFELFASSYPNTAFFNPLDGEGKFNRLVPDFEGMLVFDANAPIIERLRAEGSVFKKDQISHSYPHCWRTDKPLIYMAMSSWFVKVPGIREKLVAKNQNINWIPEHIKDGRFGKWLEGARDWSISRGRFWGTPIPVWKSPSGKVIVVGSIEELEKLSGKKVVDLHRPYIDEIKFEKDGEIYTRIEDVFDCWFESGAMPFANVHYPFENKEWFERNYPSDFIAEGLDQTRGWFYSLAVLGVALFDEIPYKTCNCIGLVFDEKGQKLSKRLGNYEEPDVFIDKFGSDALRWFMMNSPVLKGEILRISKEGTEVMQAARRSVMPLYNAYHFFTLYANADGIKAERDLSSIHVLDRYIIARVGEVHVAITAAMDAYDLAAVCREAEEFMDELNNWYIRLSRERFWGTSVSSAEQQAAFNTLYVVLRTLCKMLAPMLPFTTDYIWREITGEGSVHLTDWSKVEVFDAPLVEAMKAVRLVCSAQKALREEVGMRNRQPLAKMTIATSDVDKLGDYIDLIDAECNVKYVDIVSDIDKYAESRLYIFTPIVGKRLGAALREVQAAAREGKYEIVNDVCKIAGYELAAGEFEIKVEVKDGIVGKATIDNSAVVMLDTELTPALVEEGLMRDFMRAVQEERKNAGFHVADRIELTYSGTEISDAWAEEIKKTVLAVSFAPGEGIVEVAGTPIKFSIKKV